MNSITRTQKTSGLLAVALATAFAVILMMGFGMTAQAANPGEALNTTTGATSTLIQAVINDSATVNGHTIEVGEGTFGEELNVDKELTFNGANVGVSGDDASRVAESTLDGSFKVTVSNVTIDGFEITGGDVQAGEYSGVYIVSSSNDVVVQNNVLDNSDSSLTGRGVINEIGGVSGLEILDNKFTGWATGAYTQNAQATIISSNFFDGNNVGISSDGPNGVTVVENNILNSNLEGIGVGPGSQVDISINYNNITGNTAGLGNYTSTELDAEKNWWGSQDGPSTTSTSTAGDSVNEDVDFTPWLCAEYDGESNPLTTSDGNCEVSSPSNGGGSGGEALAPRDSDGDVAGDRDDARDDDDAVDEDDDSDGRVLGARDDDDADVWTDAEMSLKLRQMTMQLQNLLAILQARSTVGFPNTGDGSISNSIFTR